MRPYNPIPALKSRWQNVTTSKWIVIDRVQNDPARRDIRIDYHDEDGGRKGSTSYARFRRPMMFAFAPITRFEIIPPQSEAPSSEPTAPVRLAPSDLIIPILDRLDAIKEGVERGNTILAKLAGLWEGAREEQEELGPNGAHGAAHGR